MAEEVTYADLKFMTLRQTKKQQEEGGIRDKASPLVSHRWRLAAAILGIFCVALLGASGALSFKVLQVHRIARRQNENLTQQREMVENLLTTLSVLQDRNLNLSETVQQLSNKGSNSHRCSPCPERWIQHGENCYYLSTKWNSWEESKVQCATLNSRLLKIESFCAGVKPGQLRFLDWPDPQDSWLTLAVGG
ncbi:C-type lectin domain family 12 member A-like isoform X2 [Paroedura picta]|uniref:C-type lectin domain family 12 member A-like isoform X2 n=1 Tax=Paroedura picta TaxID=143630 RepID=UPI0040569C63